MKIRPQCIPCLLERATFECDIVLNEDDKKINALKEVIAMVGKDLLPDTVPAQLGTERERIIKRRSGKKDPYEKLKDLSNKLALQKLGIAERFHEKSDDKIKSLIKIAATSNLMEYGVKGHEYGKRFEEDFEKSLEDGIANDLDLIKTALEKYDRILYLTDNCGEVVFDRFVCQKLALMGKEITVAPKSEPIIDDATIEDLKKIGFDFPVVPSGAYVGLSLDEAPEDFLDLFWDSRYLIIAKGMGYYETLSEFEDRLKGRLIYVLTAKCQPVADSIGVERGSLVSRCV